MYHSSTISQRRRDEEKRKSCKEHGINLIEINYQEWNHKSTSSELFQILKSHKLKLQSTKKISISPSSSSSMKLFQKKEHSGKFILLQKWNSDQDPTGW